MTQTATIVQAGTINIEPSFLSEFNSADIFERKVAGFERNRPDPVFENDINNYLKTPAEMDADFRLEMGEHGLMVREWILLKKDGHSNAYTPDDIPSGFMEENY